MTPGGWRRARASWRTAGAVYLAQLALTFAFLVGIERTFAATFAARPLFDRAAAGDLLSILLAFDHQRGLVSAMFWMGLALAGGYALVSLWLDGVLIGALIGALAGGRRPGAGRLYLAFVRLWICAAIPYAIALVWIGFALAMPTDRWLVLGVDRWRALGHVALVCAPGLVIFFVTACAVDYARIELTASERPEAFRSLLRGYRLVFTRGRALGVYVVYLLAWLAVTVVYLKLADDGAGVLGLLILRQLVALARWALRVSTVGAEVEIYSAT